MAPSTQQDPAAVALDPAAAPWVLVVMAPDALKSLLERYLDLARLPTLAAGQAIGTAELNRLVAAAPAQARELLQTEGYFDANVQVERQDLAGQPTQLRLRVTPGPVTRVQRFNLEVEGELARSASAGDAQAVGLLADLRSNWALKTGTAFRNADWSDAKSNVLARLRAAGYATAVLSGSTAQVDADQHQARLYVVADAGPLFRSGRVDIEGLSLHGRETVLNQARFGTGTPVTDSLLLDFQDRLLKSGLFEQATVTLDVDAANAGAAVVQVRVKEFVRHQLTTGVGISSNSGPRATIEHIDRRVMGWPLTARNKLEWGRDRQAWDGELSTQVKDDGYRWFTGATIERLTTDTDVVLSQRVRAGRALEHARIERSQYLEWDRANRRTALVRRVNEALTANQTWLWRDIDSPLLPTDGETLSLQLAAGQARGNTSGSSPLLRVLGRATFYRSLGRGWFGQARVEAGQVFMKEAVATTDNLGFRAGGDNSVRGYAFRSLGPLRDGAVASGKVLLTGSAEVARPIMASMPSLWGAVFVDVGNAADTWGALKPVAGSGVGLRWRSPVGPLQLDLAYGHAVKEPRLHFSVGIVF